MSGDYSLPRFENALAAQQAIFDRASPSEEEK